MKLSGVAAWAFFVWLIYLSVEVARFIHAWPF